MADSDVLTPAQEQRSAVAREGHDESRGSRVRVPAECRLGPVRQQPNLPASLEQDAT